MSARFYQLKLRLYEVLVYLGVGMMTLIFDPKGSLLAIPFLIIIATRRIFTIIEDDKFAVSLKNEEGKKE